MATNDRRNSMTLDEVSVYWRQLRAGETPHLNRLLNSIATIDLAFGGTLNELSKFLSAETWQLIRNELFNVLITSFPGYFLIYQEFSDTPVETAEHWPERGCVEFCPLNSKRQSDIMRSPLDKIDKTILLSLRWCSAEGRNEITPDDFKSYKELSASKNDEDALEAKQFIDRLCEVCVSEANKSRRIAHRRWWRLSSEASSCADKRKKNMIMRQMGELETIWG